MFCGERLLSPGPREFLTPDVCHGLAVTSPVAGVGSRRWTLVADAAWRSGGKAELRRALSAEGFAELEAELALDLVACAHCAAVVKARGLGTHQASNAACRWRRAMVEVRRLWAKGSRDPWSVAGAPLEWGALKAEATVAQAAGGGGVSSVGVGPAGSGARATGAVPPGPGKPLA